MFFCKLPIRDTGVMDVTRLSHSDRLHPCFDRVDCNFPETLVTATRSFSLATGLEKDIQLDLNIISWLFWKVSYLRVWAFYRQGSLCWYASSIRSVFRLPLHFEGGPEHIMAERVFKGNRCPLEYCTSVHPGRGIPHTACCTLLSPMRQIVICEYGLYK